MIDEEEVKSNRQDKTQIRIGDSPYFMRADRYQYLLTKEYEAKDRVTKETFTAYDEMWTYQTIDDLFDDFVDLIMRRKECKSVTPQDIEPFAEASRRIRDIHSLIDEVARSKHWVMDKKDEIRIGHTHLYIHKDRWSYNLAEDIKTKNKITGIVTNKIVDLFFYVSVEQLLHRLTDVLVRTSKAKNMDDFNKGIDKTNKLISEMVKSRHWILNKKKKEAVC